jgi:hypothetical protein
MRTRLGPSIVERFTRDRNLARYFAFAEILRAQNCCGALEGPNFKRTGPQECVRAAAEERNPDSEDQRARDVKGQKAKARSLIRRDPSRRTWAHAPGFQII